MQKNLIKLTLITLITIGFSNLSQAAGIVLSPPKFEFTTDPGREIEGIIKITNQDPNPIQLNSETQDFVASGETGQPSFINPEENEHSSLSLAKWVTINNGETVTIQPGEKKSIPFKITVPEEAEPGGHYGSMFFFPPAGEGQVAVVQKIGSLVLVRVSGEIREEGNLANFGLYPKELEGQKIPETSQKTFFEKLSVNFATRYQNTGNVHLKPKGQIEITKTPGGKLENIGVEAVVNPQGVKIEDKIVNYLPVNDGNGNVLASSYRKFDSAFHGIAYWYKNEDGSKEIRFRGATDYSGSIGEKITTFFNRIKASGLYTAKLELTGAKGEKTEKEVSFTVFAWKEIIGGIVGTVILIFGIIRYRKWSHKKLEERIRKQMTAQK